MEKAKQICRFHIFALLIFNLNSYTINWVKRQNFTPIQNILFDEFLRKLTYSELKIMLVILRQTNGWIDKRTGKRKIKDRISYRQFIEKTGLSRRIISASINSLYNKGLISVFDNSGTPLDSGYKRKGKSDIYYSTLLEPMQRLPIQTSANNDTNMCKSEHQLVQNMVYNKRNYNKIKYSKERENKLKEIKEIINENYFQ